MASTSKVPTLTDDSVDEQTAVTAAQDIVNAMGFGLLPVDRLFRGEHHWVVQLKNEPLSGVPFVVVHDSGSISLHPTAWDNEWFDNIVEVIPRVVTASADYRSQIDALLGDYAYNPSQPRYPKGYPGGLGGRFRPTSKGVGEGSTGDFLEGAEVDPRLARQYALPEYPGIGLPAMVLGMLGPMSPDGLPAQPNRPQPFLDMRRMEEIDMAWGDYATDQGHYQLTEALRAGKFDDVPNTKWNSFGDYFAGPDISDHEATMVNALDTMAASYETTHDVVLFRGMALNDLPAPGTRFKDKGYTSCSISKEMAYDFALMRSGQETLFVGGGGTNRGKVGDIPVAAEIHVPKGTNYFIGVPAIGEVVLERGLEYRVLGYREPGQQFVDPMLGPGVDNAETMVLEVVDPTPAYTDEML